MKASYELTRTVRVRPYLPGYGPEFRLELYDCGRSRCPGKNAVGYRLIAETLEGRHEVFNSLDDHVDSHLHTREAIDSDGVVRALMAFLTLRPGDTDQEWFDSYTAVQWEFADNHAEAVAACVFDRFGGG